MRLDNKVAIVTGGAQGIGRQIALTFAREGAKVAIGDVKDDGAQTTVGEIQAAGGVARWQHCDVTKLENLETLVQATVEEYGRLDVLVNDAAAWKGGTAVEMSVADWELGRQSILDAAFYACKCAIPRMANSGGGSIITISSVHGVLAARRSVAYEAAKGALILLMKQIACDYGPHGIRANCICPGLIVTEKTRQRYEDSPARARFAAEVYPVRRYGRPEDIANAALFLASDESSFVSGHALVVDGGMTSQLQDSLAYHMAEFLKETGSFPS